MLYLFFVFIYILWHPTRFPCQMMLVLFHSNTKGVTSGAGIASSSGVLSSSPVFSGILAVRSVVFSVVFRRSVFVILFLFFWYFLSLTTNTVDLNVQTFISVYINIYNEAPYLSRPSRVDTLYCYHYECVCNSVINIKS